MSASLVGSEMCIRDRPGVLAWHRGRLLAIPDVGSVRLCLGIALKVVLGRAQVLRIGGLLRTDMLAR
eukprot:12129231-Alexandrium_andersonii.AAC.1